MKWILYLLFSMLMIQNVMAWGNLGHKIVAEIAEENLTPSAKTAISKILSGKSLASVANWADSIRSKPEWSQSKTWHYVDIPDGGSYETIPADPDGNVVTAITETISVLKSNSLMEKQYALMFLIHFMGDIHQPLHVGRPDDHGGNTIKVIFNGKKTNLHSLWDSGMINEQGMDHVQYAQHLQDQGFINPSYDLPEVKFSQIISEDMLVRKQIYFFHIFDDQQGPIILSADYMNRNLATMNSRLLLGGKRLANVLNTIFK